MKNKKITLEDIEKAMEEIYGKMSQKEIADFSIKDLGNGLYRLPGGAITGEGGVKLFNKVFKEEAEKFLKKNDERNKNDA